MAPSTLSSLFVIIAGVLLLSAHLAKALELQYCSGLNTGSTFNQVTQQFQSNGACFDTCKQTYAFAIVQGYDCWCSDYAPGETTSAGDCDENCPGFGFEKCGSSSKGLYGYIALNKPPSGTQGAPTTSSTSTSEANDRTRQVSISAGTSLVTVFETVTASPSAPISSVVTTTTESSAEPPTIVTTTIIPPSTSIPETMESSTFVTSTSSTSTSSTNSPTTQSSTWTPTPVTSIMTVTGELRTVTITPTQPPQGASHVAAKGSSRNNFWSSAGKVAGLFVGLALIVLLTAAGVLLYCWRRHRQNTVAPSAADDIITPRSRSMSELGLIGSNRTIMGERVLPRLATGGAMGGSTASRTSHSPHSPSGDTRRFSQATRIVDQRLEPGALWNANFDNNSRVSLRSLQDDQDYSRRVLRLANPDATSTKEG